MDTRRKCVVVPIVVLGMISLVSFPIVAARVIAACHGQPAVIVVTDRVACWDIAVYYPLPPYDTHTGSCDNREVC